MDLHRFDALTSSVAPFSQSRPALIAAISAVQGQAVALAGKRRKNRKKRKKKGPVCAKSAEQRCSDDAATCRAMIMGRCEDTPEVCLSFAACCDTCSSHGMFTCLQALE
jgi:hypothetical protein